MDLKRIVNGVEILAAVAALVVVIMLFANEPASTSKSSPSFISPLLST